jgi:hypothetical protein
MRRPANLPTTSGVFTVIHAKSKQAYVGKAKNLRQRASMWDYHLKTPPVPVRNWPDLPADEWSFVSFGELDEAAVRARLEGRGFRLINGKARTRTTFVVQGIEATLSAHAARLGVGKDAVYKRVMRGATPEQALGLAPVDAVDARDQAIEMMRVKILSDSGGWLTYDEAIQMRPELGDVRRKIQKWRKRNPGASEVRLRDIPLT